MIKKIISSLIKNKKTLLLWDFYFFPSEIQIIEKYENKYDQSKAKLIGFVHFIFRYFYICDERVVIPTKAYFLGRFKYGKEVANPYSFYENLINEFTTDEVKATSSYFSRFNNLLPLPPLKMISQSNDDNRFALYSFKVWLNKNTSSNNFKISLSPDKVLLPILTVTLYDYLIESISAKDKRILNEIVEEICSDTDIKNYRNLNTLINQPNIILKNKGILGEVEIK